MLPKLSNFTLSALTHKKTYTYTSVPGSFPLINVDTIAVLLQWYNSYKGFTDLQR